MRFRARLGAIRGLRLFTGSTSELRQFVYLDEVALRSLMAARYGAEDVKVIESLTRAREYGGSARADLNVPAVSGVRGEGRFKSTTSRARQVERQTTVQSMFKEFLDREVSSNAITWDATAGATPGPEPFHLRRGELIQVRVELAADPTYRISAFIAEYSEMMRSLSDDGLSPMDEVTQLSGLLERLMVGQIPIRARVFGYDSLTAATSEPLHGAHDDTAGPLYLVATTELDQYWTDTRRVLFGEQSYTVLARVVEDGPTENWSPIKLFDMVRGILPDLQDKFTELQAVFEDTPMAASHPPAELPALETALTHYATELGLPVREEAVREQIRLVAADAVEHVPSATHVNGSFDSIDGLAVRLGYDRPRGLEALELRSAARRQSALNARGEVPPSV
ncbi:DUF6414 family protein [Nocardioides renjunii]|uniref:DUF6414 family protein n=1 Tax=Nocardioides renjunii TaxID=3095075 RepID=UPI002AFF82BC|nr:hypothetical protein [Nocardioides sp. S-34]WQQ21989.1 hypothetical protein SHK17_19125 [Nocardioides sp. S-34]